MAADRNIVFKVEVNETGAITKLKSVTKGIKDIDLSSKNAKGSVDKLTSSLGNVGKGVTTKNIKLTSKELASLQKQVGGVGKASGAAAATTLELGRVISDAPYGIRGMANNVSQVASQLAFMSRSVDEVTGKVVGFSGAIKGVWKSMMGPLGILLAIQAVIAAIDYFAGSTKKATKEVGDLDEALQRKINTLTILRDELLATYDVYMVSNALLDKRIAIVNELAKTDKRLATILKQTVGDEERRNKAIDDYIKLLQLEGDKKAKQKELNDEINKTQDELLTLRGLLDDNRGTEMYWLLQDEILKIENKRKSVLGEILEIQGKIDKLTEDSDVKTFGTIAYWEQRIKPLRDDQKNLATTTEKYKELQREIDQYQKNIDAITGKRDNGGDPEERPDEVSVGGVLSSEEQQVIRDKNAKFFAETLGITNDENMTKMEKQMAFHQSMLNNETLFELERTNTAKEGAKERLETQLKYLDAVGAGLQAMSQIAGEETAAGKALAVAGATIDTYAAIAGVLANTAKTASGGIPGFAIAQAVTTGLFGLANVKKILETSVPGGGGGVGGGGSLPSASRTFDFNLAGSTGQNQLAQTIGGQVQQPIKAYVVSSEITNQQQFDNQIQGEVTIG